MKGRKRKREGMKEGGIPYAVHSDEHEVDEGIDFEIGPQHDLNDPQKRHNTPIRRK